MNVFGGVMDSTYASGTIIFHNLRDENIWLSSGKICSGDKCPCYAKWREIEICTFFQTTACGNQTNTATTRLKVKDWLGNAVECDLWAPSVWAVLTPAGQQSQLCILRAARRETNYLSAWTVLQQTKQEPITCWRRYSHIHLLCAFSLVYPMKKFLSDRRNKSHHN